MVSETGTGQTLLIYCAASSSSGYGHLSRCLNLARTARRRGIASVFLIASDELRAVSLVERVGFTAETSTRTNKHAITRLREIASSLFVPWVVIDTYEASPKFIAEAGRLAPVLVIDDLLERDMSSASLVLTPAPYVGARRATGFEMLAGPHYALVAEEFSNRRGAYGDQRVFEEDITRIGVAFGATDSGSFLSSVLSLLAEWPGCEIRTAGYVRLPDSAGPSVSALGHLSSEEMAEFMTWSDLFIASASTLTWELATLGVPSLFVMTAPNQARNIQFLRSQGIPVATSPAEISELLNPSFWTLDYRVGLSSRMADLCDGLGAERVIERMFSLER